MAFKQPFHAIYIMFFQLNLLKHDFTKSGWSFLTPSYGKYDINYGNYGTGGGHCEHTDNFSEMMCRVFKLCCVLNIHGGHCPGAVSILSGARDNDRSALVSSEYFLTRAAESECAL